MNLDALPFGVCYRFGIVIPQANTLTFYGIFRDLNRTI